MAEGIAEVRAQCIWEYSRDLNRDRPVLGTSTVYRTTPSTGTRTLESCKGLGREAVIWPLDSTIDQSAGTNNQSPVPTKETTKTTPRIKPEEAQPPNECSPTTGGKADKPTSLSGAWEPQSSPETDHQKWPVGGTTTSRATTQPQETYKPAGPRQTPAKTLKDQGEPQKMRKTHQATTHRAHHQMKEPQLLQSGSGASSATSLKLVPSGAGPSGVVGPDLCQQAPVVFVEE